MVTMGLKLSLKQQQYNNSQCCFLISQTQARTEVEMMKIIFMATVQINILHVIKKRTTVFNIK